MRPIPTRPLTAFALVFLFASEAVAATHAVYTYRDAEGVSHFSNEPLPGAVPFDVRQPRDRAATAEVERSLEPIIREYAEEYRVEAALVKAVIRAESGFDANAVSERGASGLMQLMPATAHRHGVTRLHDPRENIRGGVRYLRTLLDRYDDDPRLALAAYNAGTARVTRYHGLPPYRETRRYVVTVLRFRREYSATSARQRGRSSANPHTARFAAHRRVTSTGMPRFSAAAMRKRSRSTRSATPARFTSSSA